MCGRFTLRTPAHLVEEALGLFDGLPSELPSRYNIAPTQTILAIRQTDPAAKPAYASMRWGLVPSWADDVKVGHRLINARSDGVADKPAFRAAFKRRRCLIVADGFYEWHTPAKAEGTPKSKVVKQPYHIHRRDGRPFAFAGLWEQWFKGEVPLESCTIITTDANDVMRPLHDRMPVILDHRDYGSWMNPETQDPALLTEMLRPCPDEWLVAEAVSTAVNNPRVEGPECLQRAEVANGSRDNEPSLW
jgi:putative SOS response-associated peptidase YedK